MYVVMSILSPVSCLYFYAICITSTISRLSTVSFKLQLQIEHSLVFLYHIRYLDVNTPTCSSPMHALQESTIYL
jgi:hypothetical protein